MSSTVTPRNTQTHVEVSKRWSAPPRSSKTAARSVRAPEELVRDVRGLKMRQRVSLALSDDVLRGELEEMLSSHSIRPTSSDGFRTYQDFLIPSGALHGSGGFLGYSVSAISDIRGADTLHYTKRDRQLRCKLASVYRLMQMFGWGNGVYDRGACTVCVTGNDNEEKRYFVAPSGLMFSEITASAILKVDDKGAVVEQGSTNLGISKSVFDLHEVIHSARKDAKCVMFVAADSVKVVSALKQGFVPITPEGIAIGDIAYHEFPGIKVDEDVRDSLINSFGSASRVLILRNYGAICVGENLEEAVYLAHLLVTACGFQLSSGNIGTEELLKIDDETKEQMIATLHGGMDANENQQNLAEMNFEAWMRQLDAKGCKTGYSYRNKDIFKSEPKEPKSHEAVPAKTSSGRSELVSHYNADVSLRRSASLGRANTYRSRLKWLNAPVKATEYKRERDLNISEPVLIKDMKPEKEHKDDEVLITSKVVSVEESAPPEDKEPVSEEVVTVVQTEKQHFEPDDLKLILDDQLDAREPVDVSLQQPAAFVRRQSGSKVKKRRSFREKMSKRLSSGH